MNSISGALVINGVLSYSKFNISLWVISIFHLHYNFNAITNILNYKLNRSCSNNA